jgi:hypothetical protein
MEWVAALRGSIEAAFFLTNDARLPSVPGPRMLSLDELKAKP